MKKTLIVGILCLAAAFSAHAQKSSFVPEKDMMKIQKPSKDAVWPKPSLIFDKDLKAGKATKDSWKVENGELVAAKENQPLFIKKTSPQFYLVFEFTCAEDDEGYVFLRASKGDLDNAVKVKLSGKNIGKNEENIGSINNVIWDQRDKMHEPKGERWVTMYISAEGDSMRLGDPRRTGEQYADRQLNKIPFAKIAEKAKIEVADDGEIGFVSTKGTLKFRKVYLTQF